MIKLIFFMIAVVVILTIAAIGFAAIAHVIEITRKKVNEELDEILGPDETDDDL